MNHLSSHLFFRNRLVLIMLLSVSFLHVSCEKEPEPLTSNSAIIGEIYVTSSYTGIYHSEPWNIRVTATGPYGSKSVLTPYNGKFIITGLGNGTYYLDFSGEDIGAQRRYGIQLFGNDTVDLGKMDLFEKVNKRITAPDFTRAYVEEVNGYTRVCIETNKTEGRIPLMLFMDTDKDVSYTNFVYPYSGWADDYNHEDRLVLYVDTRNLPFMSGDEVFLIGYICNVEERYWGNFDMYHGVKQYSTLEKDKYSNRISFIMP